MFTEECDEGQKMRDSMTYILSSNLTQWIKCNPSNRCVRLLTSSTQQQCLNHISLMCLRVSESPNQWFLFICSFWKWHLMTTSVILSTSLLTVLLAHMVAINWRNQFKEAKGKGNLSAHSKLLNQKERMWSCEASWTGSPPTASEALGLHRWWRTTANKLGSISEFFQPVYLSTVLSINLSVCLYGKKLCALNFFRCGDRIHPHTASEAHHTVYTGLLSKTFWKKKTYRHINAILSITIWADTCPKHLMAMKLALTYFAIWSTELFYAGKRCGGDWHNKDHTCEYRALIISVPFPFYL